MTAPLHPDRVLPAALPVPCGAIMPKPQADPPLVLIRPPKSLGEALLAQGVLEPGALVQALQIEARSAARLEDILLAHGMVDEAALARVQAVRWGACVVDPCAEPPDPRLVDALGAAECVRLGVLPWRRAGGTVIVVAARPDAVVSEFSRLRGLFGPVTLAVAEASAMAAAVRAVRGSALQQRAETRVPEEYSCRGAALAGLRRASLCGLSALVLGLVLAPVPLLAALTAWAVLMLVAGSALKLAAAVAAWRARPLRADGWDRPPAVLARWPVISLLVPLHGERDIAPRLVQRLDRLTYPRELLDVILVLEEDDTATGEALATAQLPPWMRVLRVPPGTLRTKPRALNYALDHCRGSIVGIYDAEDAPAPDQLHQVARRFAARGSDVACLQGVLDHYNARETWLARCFAVEYATWFRLVLPGLARLGLVVPLGGTTVFLRREALERAGGWDAHNVTEDADLGLRLARAGYTTELFDSVTEEESTCHVLPWIRQRSRWIKGYAITYAAHMRAPGRLWRDLGAWRFWGVQLFFLSTLTAALLAPVLWSFWLVLLGLGHPMAALMPTWAVATAAGLFVTAEAVTMGLGLAAVSQCRRHRWLRPWVPTLHLYYPLATLAAVKALWELISRPLFWDKTEHGRFDGAALAPIVFAGRRPTAPGQAGAEGTSGRQKRLAGMPQGTAGLSVAPGATRQQV